MTPDKEEKRAAELRKNLMKRKAQKKERADDHNTEKEDK